MPGAARTALIPLGPLLAQALAFPHISTPSAARAAVACLHPNRYFAWVQHARRLWQGRHHPLSNPLPPAAIPASPGLCWLCQTPFLTVKKTGRPDCGHWREWTDEAPAARFCSRCMRTHVAHTSWLQALFAHVALAHHLLTIGGLDPASEMVILNTPAALRSRGIMHDRKLRPHRFHPAWIPMAMQHVATHLHTHSQTWPALWPTLRFAPSPQALSATSIEDLLLLSQHIPLHAILNPSWEAAEAIARHWAAVVDPTHLAFSPRDLTAALLAFLPSTPLPHPSPTRVLLPLSPLDTPPPTPPGPPPALTPLSPPVPPTSRSYRLARFRAKLVPSPPSSPRVLAAKRAAHALTRLLPPPPSPPPTHRHPPPPCMGPGRSRRRSPLAGGPPPPPGRKGVPRLRARTPVTPLGWPQSARPSQSGQRQPARPQSVYGRPVRPPSRYAP